jgi:putative ubiquitin-RnfH superfamily antitoxin RatB of RatAB toxin-antitoxin module
LWTRNPGVAFYWFSKSIDELEAIVEKTDAHSVQYDAAKAKPSATITTELAGLKATARCHRGQFDVRLWSEDEQRVVGTYFGGLNNPMATFVLDELTIQGTRHLDERLRGCGVGAGLIDLAEKVSGLRAVPHGFMGTDGSTSDDAWKSWQSRKLRQPVPGMEGRADIDARAAMLPEMAARHTLKFNTDDYDRGLLLARELGLGLTTVSFGSNPACFFPSFNDVVYAFPTRSDGSVVSGTGGDDLNSAISNNLILNVSDKRLDDADIGFIEAENVEAKIEDRKSPGFYRPLTIDPLMVEIVREREVKRPQHAVASAAVYGL